MDRQWKKKGRKLEGITLAGSGSWMPAKIKKEGKRKQDRVRQRSFTQLKEMQVKRNIETQRPQRTTAMVEDRKERVGGGGGLGGGSWHILQLLFLTAIRTCQSLSTCHSSALIGGLSLQIAQIKIPHSRDTGLDPHLPHIAKCLPTQSPTLTSGREEVQSERGCQWRESGRAIRAAVVKKTKRLED